MNDTRSFHSESAHSAVTSCKVSWRRGECPEYANKKKKKTAAKSNFGSELVFIGQENSTKAKNDEEKKEKVSEGGPDENVFPVSEVRMMRQFSTSLDRISSEES